MSKLSFEYKIKKNKLSRNIRINISHDGEVIVTCPKYIPERFAHAFVEEKKDWILSRVKCQRSNVNFVNLTHGSEIPYLGEKLKLYIIEKPIQNAKATVSSNDLLLKVPTGKSQDQKLIKNTIIKEFKKKFREIVTESVEEYNKFYNFQYNRIAIKDNRSNWGSCSTKRNLNFNWKLILAPLEILDYVVIHELCHLKEHNHSENFWGLVSQKIPDYKKKRKWLKENANSLII